MCRFAGPSQVEMILTFEEFCGGDGEFASDHGKPFAGIFAQVSGNNYCSISYRIDLTKTSGLVYRLS